MKKRAPFTALFVLAFCMAAFGQGTGSVLQGIVSNLKTYENNHIIEKAYLSFDKPYYAAGDTMYFKAYLVIGDRHEVSQASGIVHVDLVDLANNIISNIILKVNKGTAAGDFTLPETLASGIYHVRAYTRYMENAPDYFFDKAILIGNGNSVTVDNHQSPDADIQFFPEGGDLVASLISRVAFKAIGSNGLGVKVKGTVIDDSNIPVASFTSNDLGMGSFFIQPEAGKTYKVKITYTDGKQSTVTLPDVKAKGIVLHAKDTLGKISIDIVCNKPYLQENINKEINLLVFSGGTVRQVNAKLDNRDLGLTLQSVDFPSGVMRITLFSQEGEPLSERLVFLQNPDMLNIGVSTGKQSYKTRDRVHVNMAVQSNSAGAEGYFSAAVIDENRVPFSDNDETSILSYLLLSSEVKGYIEKPNYYFAQNTGQTQNDLDVLMMTQGYRKFTWKQLVDDTAHFTHPAEKSLAISGLDQTGNNAPNPDKDVMLLDVKSGAALGTKTDRSGKFVFDNLAYDDGTEFLLEPTGSAKNKSAVKFTVQKENEPAVISEPLNTNYITAINKYAGQRQAGMASGTSGNLSADQQIQGSDLSGSPSLTEGIKSHLANVDFKSNMPYLKGNQYPMLIVIDGKIIASNVNLNDIAVSNISDIKLLKGKNAETYGNNGTSGVLVINTKYGSSGTDLSVKGDYKYQVRNTVKTSTQKRPLNDAQYRSSNLGGAGHADQVVHAETFKYSPSLSSGLNGVLHGVNFVNGVPYLQGSTVVTGMGEQVSPMYVLMDGTEVLGSLDNINPLTVETVELLKGSSASIYGVKGGFGVLVLTSKTALDESATNQATLGNLQFKAHGFYKAREFYSPRYEVSSAQNTPDTRSTIYWNPNIVTDKDGNASFEFYNSDGRGSYRVIVEGMDTKGNLGWKVYRYKVE